MNIFHKHKNMSGNKGDRGWMYFYGYNTWKRKRSIPYNIHNTINYDFNRRITCQHVGKDAVTRDIKQEFLPIKQKVELCEIKKKS